MLNKSVLCGTFALTGYLVEVSGVEPVSVAISILSYGYTTVVPSLPTSVSNCYYQISRWSILLLLMLKTYFHPSS